jgi:hypothetical protein
MTMPVFVIKAKDKLAAYALSEYKRACLEHGLEEQAYQVGLAEVEIYQWQAEHPHLMKMPDHQHVPAGVADDRDDLGRAG